MDRRAVVRGLAIALMYMPIAAEAQPTRKVYRVGVLFEVTPIADMIGPEPRSTILRAFLDGLRELGYVEEQNVVIERRSAEGNPERLPGLAAELNRLNLNVILASGEQTTPALLAATTAIPIVQPTLTDPMERGYIKTLARPGGNITGLSLHVDREIYGKLLELLKEAAPRISRVAVLHRASPGGSPSSTLLETMVPVANRLRITLLPAIVNREDQFVSAFAMIEHQRADALIAELNGLNTRLQMRIVQFAGQRRIPAASAFRSFAADGGLLSYGPNISAQFRRAAAHVDKILKGARPGDLPIEQPTTFELEVNLKTAKTLGLTIPPSILVRADQVIE
jgi:putative ABC transport system substrate-binding protein